MTVYELIEKARANIVKPQITPFLSSRIGLDVLRCDVIETLDIESDYTGPFPDLNKFPKLKKLYISKEIAPSEVPQIESSTIEDLHIVLEKKGDFIQFNLPKLKKLEIFISGNSRRRLPLLDDFKAVIDIRNCIELEELSLRDGTGYEIKANMLQKLKELKCYDCQKYNFEILNSTPNLTHFVATKCFLDNLDLLNLPQNLLHLDLSCNRLNSADKVMELSKLQSLNLCVNPLDDKEKYKSLPCETFVTEKDSQFLWFITSIEMSISMAYYALKAARRPDPERSQLLQETYNKQTDGQIFAESFASHVKKNIKDCTSIEYNSPLNEEELIEFVLQKYPFLEEFFEKGGCYDGSKRK